MAKGETQVISSKEEIEKLFEHDETRKVILPKLQTPVPNDGGKDIIILYSKDDNGNPGLLYKVKHEKMNTGEALFMTVAEYEHQEVPLQMGVNKSVFNSLDRLCNSKGWLLTELPGKILHMTASAYSKYPCRECNGKGCDSCGGSGKSKVFNFTARDDLMTPSKQTKGKVADEF